MVRIQVELSKKANYKAIIYMLKKGTKTKAIAINKMIEGVKV